MEYLPGGDLYSLLQNLGSLDEASTRTYAIQIVKALEFLSEARIIHRDLKPDNILVDSRGYLHLVDFGLSYDGVGSIQRPSRAGSPDYMAPEIVLGKDHSYPVDYWSFGCIIFELLTGVPPFHEPTESETFYCILTRDVDYSVLGSCSPVVIDLLTRLLIRDPETRLGAGGIGEIMSHPWFDGTDWDHVFDIPPVFVPEPIPPEVANAYFVERYAFSGNEDDIRDDVEYDAMRADIRRKTGDLPVPPSGFHRVGLEHLDSSNREMATRLRLQPGIARPVAPATPLSRVMTFPTESCAFQEPGADKPQ